MKRVKRLNDRWVQSLLRADVDYFLKFDYISHPEYANLIGWLLAQEGGVDIPLEFSYIEEREARAMIIKWLRADADYADRLASSTARLVWPIWPLMWLSIKLMAWNLRRYAKRLER